MPLEANKVISILRKFTTCDLSDGIVKYGKKDGGYFPNLVRYSSNKNNKPMIGQAYTVLFAPKDDPRPAIKGGYIDNLPKDSVLVIATTENLQKLDAPYTKLNNALYGGLMSTRANYLKSSGTVVFGRIRDINEHLGLSRDVFAYGKGSAPHGPVVKMVGINIPLRIEIDDYPKPRLEIITPGDYIMGDDNGIVKLDNNEQVAKILEYIPKRVEADNLVMQDIREGKKCNPSQKARRAAL